MASTVPSDKVAEGADGKLPAPPAQSDLADAAAAASVAATEPTNTADSSAHAEQHAGSVVKGPALTAEHDPKHNFPRSDEAGAGTKEDLPTPRLPFRGLVLTAAVDVAVTFLLVLRFHGHLSSQVWISLLSTCLYVFFLGLCFWRRRWFCTEFVAVAVTVLLMVRFHGQPMSQVWILSVSICLYVFVLLVCIWRSRWFYTEFVLLSHGPLVAFSSASLVGPATVTFVLFFSTAWAAGYLGYYLAVHHLRKGTEQAILAMPGPSYLTRDSVKTLNFILYIVEPILVLLWTLVMVLIVYLVPLTDELEIFMTLFYFGSLHAVFWVAFVVMVPMRGVLVGEWIIQVLAAYPQWMIFSPLLCIVSKILPLLCHLLLMIVSVAFLWYNLAIYMHFLATATPSATTQGNEEIPEVKIGPLKHGAITLRNTK